MGLFNKLKSVFKTENAQLKEEKNVTTTFVGRYKMEWKEDIKLEDRDFDKITCCNESGFCRVLMEMDKVYSRADIESISLKLGYSVFDNIGGTTDKEGNPICSCTWKFVTLAKKQ